MLACYCLQGKQLASGMIGLLTCQSHYNVSGINRTPCARLLLRHPLAQRIPTEARECSVSLSLALCAGREFSGARNWRLIDGPRKGLPSLCSRLLLSPQCFDLLFGFTG